MSNVTVFVEVKLDVYLDDEENLDDQIQEVLQDMDYSFEYSKTGKAIVDSEVTDYRIPDQDWGKRRI